MKVRSLKSIFSARLSPVVWSVVWPVVGPIFRQIVCGIFLSLFVCGAPMASALTTRTPSSVPPITKPQLITRLKNLQSKQLDELNDLENGIRTQMKESTTISLHSADTKAVE